MIAVIYYEIYNKYYEKTNVEGISQNFGQMEY
jgi:hypothetical protein